MKSGSAISRLRHVLNRVLDLDGGQAPEGKRSHRRIADYAATSESSLERIAMFAPSISLRSSERPGQGGIELIACLDQFLEAAPSRRRAPRRAAAFGRVARRVLANRFPKLTGVAKHVAQVVGDLIGFAELFPEPAPGFRIDGGRRGPGERRPNEQGARLRSLIVAERDRGFGLPGLAGDDSARRADRRRR